MSSICATKSRNGIGRADSFLSTARKNCLRPQKFIRCRLVRKKPGKCLNIKQRRIRQRGVFCHAALSSGFCFSHIKRIGEDSHADIPKSFNFSIVVYSAISSALSSAQISRIISISGLEINSRPTSSCKSRNRRKNRPTHPQNKRAQNRIAVAIFGLTISPCFHSAVGIFTQPQNHIAEIHQRFKLLKSGINQPA